MTYLTAFISLQFIILTAYWLIKKYNPQGVLLTTGILMFIVAALIGIPNTAVESGTGSVFFDIFKTVSETFSANMLRGGLMIVTIGGYIAYMKSIKASDALVHITMQPLSLLRKYPYLAACCIIPIGQILFICIPSATGLGLLLAASIYPVLLRLGVSKLTAISVISACTVFDIGPGSANTMRAAELAEMNNLRYFLEFQLPVVVPMTIIMTVAYYFSSRYFDRKDKRKNADPDAVPEGGKTDASAVAENTKPDVPGIYAIFPLLPLILLILFSNYINIFGAIELDITTAIIVSLLAAMSFEAIRNRSMRKMFKSINAFWEGMGKTFASVITLIVCAEIFSRGLISLGFIDALVNGATSLGLSGSLIGIVITVVIFLAAALMGSGNASFFSFGPLIPGVASKVGMKTVDMLLPMQLSSSLGRSVSPIAGVLIAISDIGGVSPFDVARRNVIPISITFICTLLYNFIFLV